MAKPLERAELDAKIACACVTACIERANAVARSLGYSCDRPMPESEANANAEITGYLDTADTMGAWHHNAVQLVRALKGWQHNLGPQLRDA